MSRHQSHQLTAAQIIQTAKKGEPLAFHLKKTFAANKKFGSKDRKTIATLCYQYYRIGYALPNVTVHHKILAAYFLCNHTPSDFLENLAPQLNTKIHLPLSEKCNELKININQIFILQQELGSGVDAHAFNLSMLTQPKFFVRVRPNVWSYFISNLEKANIDYQNITDTCIALPQSTALEKYAVVNKDVVVQDYNSQQVFNYVKENVQLIPTTALVWDCCAASGGKSILLYDILKGQIHLSVSDVRASMLNNLRTRFKEAGINNYQAFVADLSKPMLTPPKIKFDFIICDVPCSGSGTWGRTPEQLVFFEKPEIKNYHALQKKISSSAITFLKKGGLFFYITCSVFEQENEEVVKHLATQFNLKILQMQYLKGYQMQADTMFVAVLTF